MGTFLCSAVLLAALGQAPPAAPTQSDSLAALWTRVAHDSTDAPAWFELGRSYVRFAADYHRHAGGTDSTWARAVLDTAERAFASAAALAPESPRGDSARTYRVFVWGERALLEWELGGLEAAAASWNTLPDDLRLLPVMQELGENLLRACPREGVLITAGDADTYAAWYMRFARGLRTDLLIIPYAVWTADPAFRQRLAQELRLPRPARATGDPVGATIQAFAARRPVCASMGFARPPERRGGGAPVRWTARPLVWVAGPGAGSDRVPPQDFVFAALRLALDAKESWAAPALAIYRRAAATTPALCEPLGTFALKEDAGCRR